MKPLLKKDLSLFLKRFDDFKDAELRSLEIISPTIVKITLAAQDSARGFDWITISLEFDDISDAKLPQNSKLSYINMSEGVTLIHADNSFAFAVGKYETLSSAKNSVCFIFSSCIKYKEASF